MYVQAAPLGRLAGCSREGGGRGNSRVRLIRQTGGLGLATHTNAHTHTAARERQEDLVAPSVLGPIMSYMRASTLAYIHTWAHTHTHTHTHTPRHRRTKYTGSRMRGYAERRQDGEVGRQTHWIRSPSPRDPDFRLRCRQRGPGAWCIFGRKRGERGRRAAASIPPQYLSQKMRAS